MHKVCLSLGSCFPGRSPEAAMEFAQKQGIPNFGGIRLDHVQICPQNYAGGPMTMERLQALQASYPETRFRFHANVRLLDHSCQYDAGTMHAHREYTKALAPMLAYLGQPYTLHAASNGTPFKLQVKSIRALSKKAGVPVGIEGLYPARRENTVASWEQYAELLDANVYYALDFSHLNIVQHHFGDAPHGLVESLIDNPNCLEVHISGNDGLRDCHLPCDGTEWWLDLMDHIPDHTVVFYEGRVF